MVAGLHKSQSSDPEEWVDEHGDYLFNYALGQVRNRPDAEDLVQETFLAALKARAHFRGQASERTWLVGILRHKICDYFRRACRNRTVSSSSASHDALEPDQSILWIHETAAECISPSRHIDLGDFRASLEVALHALPVRIAQAFAMYEMDELASSEVCRQMDISESNLWTMVHRARKQLRNSLSVWRTEVPGSSRSC